MKAKLHNRSNNRSKTPDPYSIGQKNSLASKTNQFKNKCLECVGKVKTISEQLREAESEKGPDSRTVERLLRWQNYHKGFAEYYNNGYMTYGNRMCVKQNNAHVGSLLPWNKKTSDTAIDHNTTPSLTNRQTRETKTEPILNSLENIEANYVISSFFAPNTDSEESIDVKITKRIKVSNYTELQNTTYQESVEYKNLFKITDTDLRCPSSYTALKENFPYFKYYLLKSNLAPKEMKRALLEENSDITTYTPELNKQDESFLSYFSCYKEHGQPLNVLAINHYHVEDKFNSSKNFDRTYVLLRSTDRQLDKIPYSKTEERPVNTSTRQEPTEHQTKTIRPQKDKISNIDKKGEETLGKLFTQPSQTKNSRNHLF